MGACAQRKWKNRSDRTITKDRMIYCALSALRIRVVSLIKSIYEDLEPISLHKRFIPIELSITPQAK